MALLLAGAGPVAATAPGSPAGAADAPVARIQIDPLFGTFNTFGRWAPVIIRDAAGPDADALRGVVTFRPYSGYTSPMPRATCVSVPISFGDKERKEFRALLPLTPTAANWWVQFEPQPGTVRSRRIELPTQTIQGRPASEEQKLLVVSTLTTPFLGLSMVLAEWGQRGGPGAKWAMPPRPLSPAELPDLWLGLDAFDVILLHQLSRSDLSPAQWHALAQWTAGGRVLLLSERPGSGAMRGYLDLLGDIDLGAKTVTADTVQGLTAPVRLARPTELIELDPRDATLPPLARGRQLGLGRIVVVALDLGDDDTFLYDNRLLYLAFQRELRHLVNPPRPQPLMVSTGSPYGAGRWEDASGPALEMPELAGALLGEASISFGTVRATFVLLLLYILLVGPGSWFILKRRDRLEWMGGTTCVLALIFLLLVGGVGLSARRRSERLLTLHITEITPDWQWALQHTQTLMLPVSGRAIEIRSPDTTTPTLELPAPGADGEGAARESARSLQTSRIEPGPIATAPLLARFFTTFGIHPLTAESRARLVAAAALPPVIDSSRFPRTAPPAGESIAFRVPAPDERDEREHVWPWPTQPDPWNQFVLRVIARVAGGSAAARLVLFGLELPETRACTIEPAPGAHHVLSAVILPPGPPPSTESGT